MADPGAIRPSRARSRRPQALVPGWSATTVWTGSTCLPLLVATDGAIDTLGYDRRRFRPNLLLGGVEGYAERAWEGRALRIGEAVIRMVQLRQRCIMTTFDPDTGAQDVDVLLRIHRELGGSLALDSEVLRPGRIAVGDTVELLPLEPQRRT